MQIKKRNFILILAGVFFAGAVVMGGICAAMMHSPGYSLSKDDKLATIKSYIDEYYLNEYNEQDLNEGAYEGYVAGLGDPYSAYMPKDEYESWKASAIGNYSGVGITFSENEDGAYEVIAVNKNSPAEKAGVETGDFILTVDGENFSDSEVIPLTIYHDGKEKEITMTREEINLESVSWKMLDDNIGYIQINSFIENTGQDFRDALDAVQKKNAEGLILDLRDNGGGLVDQCIEVADEFLDEGVVCYVEDKNGKTETYDAADGRTKIPTIVLINEYSASASEILAGALKDNGYELVGTKSFGKGVIQTTMEMDDGSALKLTIMQYLSPDKHVIQGKGIKPTVKIKDKEDTEADEQLEKAEELLQ